MNKCLYCYESVETPSYFHKKCSRTFFGTDVAPEIPYGLDEMAELANNIVERSISVPGVQPKLSMSVLTDTITKKQNRFTVVGALGGQYIFKPPSEHFPEMPANEHLTMRLAELFGIRVVPSSLIKLSSGELSYITKRIDRSELGEKIHMLDMFQITEAFDKYRSSMEKVGKALLAYSDQPLLDAVFLLELTLFSFITGNNDMHLKNFSMIKGKQGWSLAPAYDLLNVSVLLPEDNEELALTLEAKKRKLKRVHFEKFGKKLGLSEKQVKGVFSRFINNRTKMDELIDNSFLSTQMKKAYRNLIISRYKTLDLV